MHAHRLRAIKFADTLRRELLDHLIAVSERHWLRAVREFRFVAYYNDDRPRRSLAGDAPFTRPVEPHERGNIVAIPKGRRPPPPVLEGRVIRLLSFSPPQPSPAAGRGLGETLALASELEAVGMTGHAARALKRRRGRAKRNG
jgi:hypothetical protein